MLTSGLKMLPAANPGARSASAAPETSCLFLEQPWGPGPLSWGRTPRPTPVGSALGLCPLTHSALPPPSPLPMRQLAEFEGGRTAA